MKSAHGTRSRYVAGCRCEACRKANCEYQKATVRRNARIAMGAEPERRADVAEAEWRVRRLLRMGYAIGELERLTGIDRATINIILGKRLNSRGGERKYVMRETIDALDALLRDHRRDVGGATLVDGASTYAILDLLVRTLGRKGAAIALGWNQSQVDNMLYRRKKGKVRKSTKEHVEYAARRLRYVLTPKEKTWEDRMEERRAAGYVVNPYTD